MDKQYESNSSLVDRLTKDMIEECDHRYYVDQGSYVSGYKRALSYWVGVDVFNQVVKAYDLYAKSTDQQ